MTSTVEHRAVPDPEQPTEPAVPGAPLRPSGDWLRLLSDEASRLAGGVGGPLRRLSLRTLDASVELEWECTPPVATPAPAAQVGQAQAVGPAPAPATDPAPATGAPAETTVTSPMVGTFYHAPAPGEAPFVSVGMVVEPDTVVGIVEAMKLMNQITAEHRGVVRDVLVGDRQAVEYQQPLLVLDPVSDRSEGHG